MFMLWRSVFLNRLFLNQNKEPYGPKSNQRVKGKVKSEWKAKKQHFHAPAKICGAQDPNAGLQAFENNKKQTFYYFLLRW